MNSVKSITFMCFLCWTITFATTASLDEENHNAIKLQSLFEEEFFNIGGRRVPPMNNIPIPDDPFLQQGFLKSLFSKQNDGNIQKDDLIHAKDKYNVSIECVDDVKQMFTSIGDNRTAYNAYAKSMFDADTKIPSGILEGNILWYGSYDECVSAESPVLESGHKIYGQYCLSSLSIIIQNRPLSIGVCVPRRCSEADTTGLINSVLSGNSLQAQSTICETSKPLSTGAIVTLVLCGVIGLLCLVGTVADMTIAYVEKKNRVSPIQLLTDGYINFDGPNERTGLLSDPSKDSNTQKYTEISKTGNRFQFLIAFSVVTNTRKLLSTSTSSGILASLNGLRVLSMWWVILGHTFEFGYTSAAIDNPIQAQKLGGSVWFQAIFNATFSVDSFFFMSGLLVTFLCLKNLREKDGKINWGLFYFHRYWRLTPAYGFVMLLYTTLLQSMIFGPTALATMQGEVLHFFGECSRSWWSNLILYINNFYPYSGNINKICMAWSWYLANDMQFFLISPIIIMLLYRYKKAGIALCGFLIASCVFIRGMTVYEYGLHQIGMAPTKHEDDPYVNGSPLYNKPYTRIAPYIVGMLLGYALHINHGKSRISKVKLLVGWTAAGAIGISTVYGLYDYVRSGKQMSLALSVVYTAFQRFAWSVALAWVIYACATGYGGLVNSILSWKVWGPLGRLTYCAYLVHPILMEVYFSNLTGRYHYSNLTIVYIYFGNLVSTYLVAYVVSMAVEAPMLGLEKLIFKR